jgi:hypothetical protein
MAKVVAGALLMKTLLVATMLALALAAQAQNIPSSKVTAKTANLTLVPKGNGGGQWVTCLENRIKTAATKDLLVTASLEIGLFTKTQVSSKNMVEVGKGSMFVESIRLRKGDDVVLEVP